MNVGEVIDAAAVGVVTARAYFGVVAGDGDPTVPAFDDGEAMTARSAARNGFILNAADAGDDDPAAFALRSAARNALFASVDLSTGARKVVEIEVEEETLTDSVSVLILGVV